MLAGVKRPTISYERPVVDWIYPEYSLTGPAVQAQFSIYGSHFGTKQEDVDGVRVGG